MLPVMTTGLPPAVVPDVGVTLVMVGIAMTVSPFEPGPPSRWPAVPAAGIDGQDEVRLRSEKRTLRSLSTVGVGASTRNRLSGFACTAIRVVAAAQPGRQRLGCASRRAV